ncbi:MAG: dihydropteroate synthase [Dehalococcoidales bacterium]|nr:dihydropteroate synthase [Dehalococcoidales bacterium]
MILIGENLNIMSQTLGPALRERNAGPVQEMAKSETAVDYIDLNIGPARKAGDELMSWVVKTVKTATNKPLSLDTTNLVAMEAGLKECKACNRSVLMNSVSLQPERLEKGLALARDYNADMIGLLWGVEGMPRDANERAVLAVDIVYKANQLGIPNERIWIDPIASPISVEINQVKACVEFMGMLKDIAPGCKSTVGLSNISNGAPTNLRPHLNRVYFIMLMRNGLYSAIVDAFDTELVKIARGQMPEFVNLVHRVMDGETPDLSRLSKKEVEYVKTTRVLLGQSLYSHSWLEV